MKVSNAGTRTISLVRRAGAAWLLLIRAELLHGTLRELLLKPYVGDRRARQLALLTGSVIVVGVACGVTLEFAPTRREPGGSSVCCGWPSR